MSSLSSEEIDHLARLARLSLNEDEKKRLGVELPKIVTFVEELQEAKARPATQISATHVNKLRPDEVSSDHLSLEDLEKLAPAWQKNQVEVPGVFENNDV